MLMPNKKKLCIYITNELVLIYVNMYRNAESRRLEEVQLHHIKLG